MDCADFVEMPFVDCHREWNCDGSCGRHRITRPNGLDRDRGISFIGVERCELVLKITSRVVRVKGLSHRALGEMRNLGFHRC